MFIYCVLIFVKSRFGIILHTERKEGEGQNTHKLGEEVGDVREKQEIQGRE